MAKQSAGAAIPAVPLGNPTGNPSHGGPAQPAPTVPPVSPAVARTRSGPVAAHGPGQGNGGGGSGK